MCVIAYKPMAAAFPSKTILKTCFNNNPDGGGFMYAAGGVVYIEKGFTTFTGFYKALKAARAKYGDNIPYVLHFRISTQAGIRRDCTHPFPLSDKMDQLRKLKTKTSIGIAHNGIISLTSTGYNRQVTYNDTMAFITDYLSLIITDKHYYRNKKTLLLIERLADSRLAILDDSGHCELIGGGWVNDGGVYYSNGSYKPYKPTKTKKTGGGYSFDFYDDGYYAAYDRMIEKAYNLKTGLYDFVSPDCPAFVDGDDSFCEDCSNYKKCFKLPQGDE